MSAATFFACKELGLPLPGETAVSGCDEARTIVLHPAEVRAARRASFQSAAASDMILLTM